MSIRIEDLANMDFRSVTVAGGRRISPPSQQQLVVAQEPASQVRGGSSRILGVVVESHLEEGAQSFLPGKNFPDRLTYGMSITDACLGWEDSVVLLNQLSDAANMGRLIASTKGNPSALPESQ